ncbi:MAG TPA: retropepsin-like aspartic protease [Methylophilus sp.]|mgnify:CR=1 FL=1|nr:retropepsin-like aspartic protease [Methylophilus sp.]HQQ33305.1 retropepsin-like aspartic protease [Methylophilus sp.]
MSKQGLLAALIWIALGGLFYYLADGVQNPNKANRLGQDPSVTLKRGLDGHYRAEAFINGHKVDVLIDTGATGVAISQRIAEQLGLRSVSAITTNTANGDSVGYLVRLDSVKVGGVEARNVSAMIVPSLQGDVLLGMSYLGRMDVRLYKGQMTIKNAEE